MVLSNPSLANSQSSIGIELHREIPLAHPIRTNHKQTPTTTKNLFPPADRLTNFSLPFPILQTNTRTRVKMHPHLHTKDNFECEDIMVALEECHAKGFMFKSLGGCNDAKDKVSECLRGARARRTEANRAAARAKREERENRIKELNKSLGLD
ncbi:hypothetical protein BDP55DRAFT_658959 [Colletotrichum godetiae]|nr:uncharacterized protein BDP55DRAFT_658959 [Colletotrichum godetiae]KAK1687625.1 hypothetical protein BDP55DRAFT_658959 [Colletotrichum godetiae]